MTTDCGLAECARAFLSRPFARFLAAILFDKAITFASANLYLRVLKSQIEFETFEFSN